MTSIKHFLKDRISFLKEKRVQNPKDSVEAFLSFVLKIKKNDLFLHLDKEIAAEDEKLLTSFVLRRAQKEPIEYILGETDFYGVKLLINSDVLIPRQETEILVDLAVQKLEKENLENKVLLDLCSGSGCIGIALKKRFPGLKIYLSDVSEKALLAAQKNAKKNNVNVFFKKGDLLKPFEGMKLDFIVCNPPYISEEEIKDLDKDVIDFEPKEALIAKSLGLEFYERIEKEVYEFLKPGAKLFFEIGYRQKKDLFKIFSSKKWKNKQIYQDFSSKDRFFFVEIE